MLNLKLMNLSFSQWLRFTTYQLVTRIFDVNIANADIQQRNWFKFDFDVEELVASECNE